MDLREEKKRLRADMIARRDALAPAARSDASARIAAAIAAHPAARAAKTIALFAAIGTETDVRALASPATLCWPRIEKGELVFATCAARDLVPTGPWKIPEPPPTAPIVALAAIELFVLPGLAFDDHHRRLGYGRGYYDRALLRARPDAKKIGACFDAQIVPRVPAGRDDVLVDAVITESRVL